MNRLTALTVCCIIAITGCQSGQGQDSSAASSKLDHDCYYKTETKVTPIIDGELLEFDVAVLTVEKRTKEVRSKVSAPTIRCTKGKKQAAEWGSVHIEVDWAERTNPVCTVDVTIENKCVVHSQVEVARHQKVVSASQPPIRN